MRKLLVLLVAAAFVFTMALPAMAADKSVDVYGSVRLNTNIKKVDNPTGFDDSDLQWDLNEGDSRFGVKFKAGDIGGNVEIRPRDRQVAMNPGTFTNQQRDLLRHWYGTWNFGGGTLVVGQTWSPTFGPIGGENLLAGSLAGYGDGGGSVRQPGLQLWFPVKGVNGMLKLAALRPNANKAEVTIAGFGATETDTSLPLLETSLSMAFGPLGLNLRGGYQTYDVVDTTTNQSVSIDSHLLQVDAKYSAGPFYFKGLMYTAQNMWTFGDQAATITYLWAPYAPVGTTVQDVDYFGWFAAAGFKISDKVSVEVGYGQREVEQKRGPTLVDSKSETSALVFILPIKVAKGFTLTPEIYLQNGGNLTENGVKGADRADTSYYGLYWQIDF